MVVIECLKALLFGIVEGITDWLPISSTGHLILLEEYISFNGVREGFWSVFEVVIQLVRHFGGVGAFLEPCLAFFQERRSAWNDQAGTAAVVDQNFDFLCSRSRRRFVV